MSSEPRWALRFEGVTKTYRERTAGSTYRSARAELAGRRGAQLGQCANTTGNATAPSRQALADVSFEVAAGEAFAVIGPNGAGKSTALRIAARVTAPTAGVVRVRGRVGALIEVGAGVHPELTGRENIWLYGAILGMSRREIAARFDDMVAFAELESSIDKVVKHYSSGMQLRLGFAIASGGSPDVLVVDEALAVGDARFQVRCLDRMAELVRRGTTLVYVSHDLASVQTACTRAELLVDGRIAHLGGATETVDAYLRWVDAQGGGSMPAPATGDGIARHVFAPGDEVVIRVPLPAHPSSDAAGEGQRRHPVTVGRPLTIALGIRDGHPWNVIGTSFTVPPGWHGHEVRCRILSLPLQSGVYQVWTSVDGDDTGGRWRQISTFRVEEPDARPRPLWLPAVSFDHAWELD